jgi:hypothetical protein
MFLLRLERERENKIYNIRKYIELKLHFIYLFFLFFF